jgi:hypothetical protein
MNSRQPASLYNKVVKVTHVYLGPAAERFIDRQVQNHIHKSPAALTEADLAKLIGWIQGAVSLLTEDSEVVEEYIAQLNKLTHAGRVAKKTKSEGTS